MPEDKPEGGFDDLMHDLEDSIFGVNPPKDKPTAEEKAAGPAKPSRRTTLPTLVDQKTANDILKDFMRKDKNQRKYDIMGVELIFKPYWFFTYSAELVTRDSNKNITDAEELSGRVAIDAGNAALADYLQDLLDHEPIETVDLADEMTQVGEAKVIEPKISEDRIEKMVQQKIAGVLRCEKENVAVAGFELLWSPVYRFWITIRKKTHNVQIDGCGGYPVNYDDVPAREKTWVDVIMNDMDLLKDPKKWKELLKNKRKAVGGMVSTSGKAKGPGSSWRTAELTAGPLLALIAIIGVANRSFELIALGFGGLMILFWYTNHQREKPLMPLPPPPFYGQGQ